MTTDADILREFVTTRSDAAFQELSRRYVPLVYSAALRQTGNAAMAEDVTQVVFILLARKAPRLGRNVVLLGWLYRTTWFVAARARRSEGRRQHTEREAAQMTINEPAPKWEHLAPILDVAMSQLTERDRAAVLLRYFQNQSLKDVGAAFGVSDDTAQKRVARALDKLRGILLARGIAVSAVGVAGLLSAHAVEAAPAHVSLAPGLCRAGKAGVSAAAQSLLRQTLRAWFWPKAIGAGIGIAALLLLGGFIAHVTTRSSARGIEIGPIAVKGVGAKNLGKGAGTIRIQLSGTPAAKFHLQYTHDGAAEENIEGNLPRDITFQADGFTATLALQGPPPIQFAVYRDGYKVADQELSQEATNLYLSFEMKKGGRGVRVSLTRLR
jgi:RNA polymerase sigma factor (sigma-70 family)